MISLKRINEINKNVPVSIERFISKDMENYLILKDGYIIAKSLDNSFDTVNIITPEDDSYMDYYMQNKEIFNYSDDAFDYNYNEANSSLIISVPKNEVVTKTLHVFYVQETDELVHNTLIILNENSVFNYFEYIANETESHVSFVSNSIVKENARLTYTGLSRLSEKVVFSAIRNGYVSRYGNIDLSVAEVNDSMTQSNTNIFLLEKYATASTKTVAITNHEQEARFKQLVEHLAPETEGFIENYGVANNNSILVFEGIGKINKNMKQSVARQSNKGIVLGVNSRLDANPLLLIDEFDVIASHGAAIGKMDDEQLYYLMSRGLTLNNAQRLIISGFLSPVLKKLSTDSLKEEFVHAVENKTL